jgi:SAM-dependent methyltransferase
MTTFQTSHYQQFGPEWYDKHWAAAAPKLHPCHLWAARLLDDPALDVGCGPGLLLDLTKDRKVVIGADFSPVAVAQCRQRGHEALVAAAESLPFPDKSFHTVVAIETLEHVDDLDAAIAELHRVAWRQIIVTVPPNLASASHKHVWPLEQWRVAFEADEPDFYDGVHVGWVLQPKPVPTNRTPHNSKIDPPLFDIDFTAATPRETSCTPGPRPQHEKPHDSKVPRCAHVAAVRDEHGFHVRTLSAEAPSAHVLFNFGRWRMVNRDYGFPCNHDSYCVCRASIAPQGQATARLFVLWYNRDGLLRARRCLAHMGAENPLVSAAFAHPKDASHFALAIHLGRQPPDHVLTIKHVRLDSISLGNQRELPRTSNLHPASKREGAVTEAERRKKTSPNSLLRCTR